ncbi:MAG: 2Fe-2S iron-sulfur cluster-binding protein [Planctomycetota bacterium]|jgi:NADPH-dependent glutamate synthase beta subunit-like oxidoreductase
MAKLIIDNLQIEAKDGSTVLDAAEKVDIKIPTMCFLKEYKASTSCMVCVVRVEGIESLVPACGTVVMEGMKVETSSDEIIEARKLALELLLSDHLGDCMGPCQVICPAGMDIPLMIRQIMAGQLEQAIATIKKDIALPAVLGRVCPAPCENGCRRRSFDQPVSICLLKRYAADVDLLSDRPYVPICEPQKNKQVAIVGAGPAGLSAAYYLLQKGFGCTVYDDHDKAGGMLRFSECYDKITSVLEKEISLIEQLGAEFVFQTKIDSKLELEKLCKKYDAVFLAVGKINSDNNKFFGLETGPNGIKINNAYQTDISGIFSGGDAVRKRKLAIRSLADGKEAASAIEQFLTKQQVTGEAKDFNIRIGKLQKNEINNFMLEVSDGPRVEVTGQDAGFTDEQAVKESARCLHCDCRKADNCKLRQQSQDYQARPSRFKGKRRLFSQQLQHPLVVYEVGKCIKCGLCIQIAAEAKEELGLTFIGRGFDVTVAVPFDKKIDEGLKLIADKCVLSCPTAALAFKEK